MEETQAEIEVTDSEVFVSDITEDENEWIAQPLSLRNTVLLARLLANVLAKLAINMDIAFNEDGNITEAGVKELLLLMDPGTFRELLCLILDKEPAWVEKTYRLKKASQIIIEFWEQEEISDLLGEAKRLATDQEFQERHVG